MATMVCIYGVSRWCATGCHLGCIASWQIPNNHMHYIAMYLHSISSTNQTNHVVRYHTSCMYTTCWPLSHSHSQSCVVHLLWTIICSHLNQTLCCLMPTRGTNFKLQSTVHTVTPTINSDVYIYKTSSLTLFLMCLTAKPTYLYFYTYAYFNTFTWLCGWLICWFCGCLVVWFCGCLVV